MLFLRDLHANRIKSPRLHSLVMISCFGLIAFLMSGGIRPARAQNQLFNPPFPRIGQITFYEVDRPDAIWQNHDLVVIRFYYPEMARKIKEKNPNTIVLATNGKIVEPEGKFPEAFYLRDEDGGKHCNKGGRCLLDITDYCPKINTEYGSMRFNEYFPRWLVDNTDWRYFDGIFFDYWANKIWSNAHLVDLNRDGRAEGKEAANAAWELGNQKIVANLRKLTNKPIIAHESKQVYLNGNGFEFWSNVKSKSYNMQQLLNLNQNAIKPVINFAEGNQDGALFRADFTSATVGGAFYGHDEGTAHHRWTFMHDEYKADLGYPRSEPIELEDGLWVRYFDRGVVISNISGSPKTVTASRLNGGPYYRFQGNQDPDFNNGAEFTSVTFKEYDGIMLFKNPTILVTPVVIDNVENNMTTIGQQPVAYKGAWKQSKKGDNAYSLGYKWDDFGYFHAYSEVGNGENVATYRPKFGLAGEYEVFEWHGRLGDPPGSIRAASNVPFVIKYAGGQKSGTIDQTRNIGRWNSLGIFRFDKGTSGYVQISNDANGAVISDAIRFVYAGGEESFVRDRTPPAAPRGIQVKSNK